MVEHIPYTHVYAYNGCRMTGCASAIVTNIHIQDHTSPCAAIVIKVLATERLLLVSSCFHVLPVQGFSVVQRNSEDQREPLWPVSES